MKILCPEMQKMQAVPPVHCCQSGKSQLRSGGVALQWLLMISVLLLTMGRASAQTSWNLVWSDEFNGVRGTIPSSSDWNFVQTATPPNGEAEHYCSPSPLPTDPAVTGCDVTRPNIYEDGNGNLVILMENRNGIWTSGRMNTGIPKGATTTKHEFQYGRMEARIKLPVGAGFWPAWWMLGSNHDTIGWPTCGEQDIMEWRNGYGPSTTSSTVHGPGYSGGAGIGSRFTFPNGGRIDDANYHTYGVVWSQNKMQFYRDDPNKPYFTVTPANIPAGDQWVFNHPFYLILNFAIGGAFGGAINNPPNPSMMLVDYVRVYEPGIGPPAAPTGLKAVAGNNQVSLSWTASAGASTYNVKRTLTSGINYALVTSGVTATSFTDTTVSNGTTYFYVVSAQNTTGESPNSNEVSATPTSGPPPPVIAINAGGPAVGAFAADTGFVGGTTINHANTINLTGVTNPAPMQVYQTARVGNFTYTIPGVTAGSSHTVRLHFAETYWTAAGKRRFNVSINGTQVLTNFDIFAAAGAMNKATIQQFTVNANASGQYVIQFTAVLDKSLLSGIEVQ